MRHYDDTVEVRTGPQHDPDGFRWRGCTWQVREVVAHWVETGAWWARPEAEGDLLAEQEVWRVTATRGAPGYGVFDLVFSWADGGWRLVRAAD